MPTENSNSSGSSSTTILGPVVLSSGKGASWFAVNTSPASTANQYATYTIVEGTTAQVEAWANTNDTGGVAGPYSTQAAAVAAADAFGPNSNYSPLPGVNISPSGKTSPANPLTGLSAIGDFFSRLSQASTWVRVAEVGLAVILIAVGVARITHAVPIATKIAKTAGAAAIA